MGKCVHCQSDGVSRNFCYACGSRTGRLKSIPELNLVVTPSEPTVHIDLENDGDGVLPVQLGEYDDALVYNGRTDFELPGNSKRQLSFSLRSGCGPVITGAVKIRSADATRPNWWTTDTFKEVIIPVCIRILTPPCISVSTKSLYFTPKPGTQSFSVRNDGDIDAVATVTAPPSCTVSLSPTGAQTPLLRCSIKPESEVKVFARWSSRAEEDEILVKHEAQTISIHMKRLYLSPGLGILPEFVVGIDFGTTGTSIRIRNTATNSVYAVGPQNAPDTQPPLADSSYDDGISAQFSADRRFPTVMFAHADGKVSLGEDAIVARDSEANGIYVSSIKTYLRQGVETLEANGKRYPVRKLLTTYLRELKLRIDSKMRTMNELDSGNTVYVFTLPVLDFGAQHEKLKFTLRQAAAEAGFPDNSDTLITIEEPFSAALQMMRNIETLAKKKTITSGLRPGQRLCIVDAGGGTTDVCIGVIDQDPTGKWQLIDVNSVALHLKSDNHARYATAYFRKLTQGSSEPTQSQGQNEVGGDLITGVFAYNSMPIGDTPNGPKFVDNVWDRMQESSSQGSGTYKVNKFVAGMDKLKVILSSDPNRNIDFRREEFRETWDECFRAATQEARLAILTGADPVFSYSDDIIPEVQRLWSEGLHECLKSAIDAVDGCDYVLPVGGTTLLPEFVEQMRLCTDAQIIEIDAAERFCAVADGSVWANDLRSDNMLTFSLQLRIRSGSVVKHIPVAQAYFPISAIAAQGAKYRTDEGDQVSLYAVHSRSNDEEELACITIGRAGEYRISVTLPSANSLQVKLRREDDEETTTEQMLWEVNL